MIVEDDLVELVAEPELPRPRLFSRGYRERTPVSDVPPEHVQVHSELIVWGNWNRTMRRSASLGSLESLYVKRGSPPSTAPLEGSAPRFCVEIERALLRMAAKQRRALRLLYVVRYSPMSICDALRIRPESYAAFMRIARAMVINLRRRYARA